MTPDARAVSAYVEAHLAEIHAGADVAAALGVPLPTLRRAFQRETGEPLGQYLTRLRVERAKRLLRETDLRCFEVGQRVGWHREDTAARAFRREVGMTMETYRQRARAKKKGGGGGGSG